MHQPVVSDNEVLGICGAMLVLTLVVFCLGWWYQGILDAARKLPSILCIPALLTALVAMPLWSMTDGGGHVLLVGLLLWSVGIAGTVWLGFRTLSTANQQTASKRTKHHWPIRW